MTNPTIASAPRAAGAMKTIPSLRVRIAARTCWRCCCIPRARRAVAAGAPEMGRAVAAVAVVAIVVCLLAVWALCRAAALGDRIGERLHDARGREEDAR